MPRAAAAGLSGLYILTDSNWVAALRYRREGGADAGYLLGGGLIIWLTFVPATGDRTDFRQPACRSEALRRRYDPAALFRRAAGADVREHAPLAALGHCRRGCGRGPDFVPGFWYIIAGTLAGAIAGGFSAMNEALPHGVFYVIAAMAAVTVFTRFAGFWMMGRVTLTPRIMRMLDALPGSVVAALILPVIVRKGCRPPSQWSRLRW